MFSIKYAQSQGERNNKPNFVALRQPPQNKGGARLTKAALSTAGKSGPLGPLLEVDRGVGVTRDFCTAVGKGIAPRADSANSTGGYPKPVFKRLMSWTPSNIGGP